jgi:hypothetical protein
MLSNVKRAFNINIIKNCIKINLKHIKLFVLKFNSPTFYSAQNSLYLNLISHYRNEY